MITRILAAFALAFALAGCAKTLPNPVSDTNLYQAEVVFDASVKTFNALKDLCARRVLPSTCRTYVAKGRDLIQRAAIADVAARNFVVNNPTIDPSNAVAVFTNLAAALNSMLTSFSSLR